MSQVRVNDIHNSAQVVVKNGIFAHLDSSQPKSSACPREVSWQKRQGSAKSNIRGKNEYQQMLPGHWFTAGLPCFKAINKHWWAETYGCLILRHLSLQVPTHSPFLYIQRLFIMFVTPLENYEWTIFSEIFSVIPAGSQGDWKDELKLHRLQAVSG